MASKRHGTPTAGKPASQRQLRVGEELRHSLAALFQRADFHDPELAALNITVTEVRISPDLRNATAFITPLGGGNMEETLKVLRRGAPFLRGQIARVITLRHVPMLSFEGDTSFDYANHIDNILHRPEVARDLARYQPPEDDDDDYEDDEQEHGTAADQNDQDGPEGETRGA